ncbi:MAG: hypothetical protein M3Y08_00515 [Fibrobacterota bacterium]|nr:hypothetical protein [Fibrobacterota bacterium]
MGIQKDKLTEEQKQEIERMLASVKVPFVQMTGTFLPMDASNKITRRSRNQRVRS